MRKTMLTVAGCLAAFGLQAATYYPITVTYTPGEDIANFPALLRIPTESPVYVSAGTNGENLRFTDALGVNDIPHEVDTWNPSGESLVWVKLPILQNNAAIRLYCDGAGSAKTENVWSDYAGVWHLNEALDSSGKDLCPTDDSVHTTIIFGEEIASAKIGKGYGQSQTGIGPAFASQVYDDRNGHKCPIQVTDAVNFSVSCWVRLTLGDESTWGSNYSWKMFFGPRNVNNGGWGATWAGSNGKPQLRIENQNGDVNWLYLSLPADRYFHNDWNHFTVVYNGKNQYVYLNGALVGSKTGLANDSAWCGTGWMGWGGLVDSSGAPCKLSESSAADFDECRIYDGVKTAVQVAADYDTVTNLNFFAIGSAREDQPIPEGTVAQVGATYYPNLAAAVAASVDSGNPVVLMANGLSWTFTAVGETVSFKIGTCEFEAINGRGDGYYLAETVDSSSGVTTYELKKQVVVTAMRNVAVYKSLETRDLLDLLPAQVAGLAADGTIIDMYDVTWNVRDITDYDHFGITPVSGLATVGGQQLPVTAYVRATIPYSDDYHNIAGEASSMVIIAPAKDGHEAITEISRIQSGGKPFVITNGLDATVVTGGVWCANSTGDFTNHQSAEAGNPYLDVGFTWSETQNIYRVEVVCQGGDNGSAPKTVELFSDGAQLSPAFHGENSSDRPKITNVFNLCYDFLTPVSSDNLTVSFEQLEKTERGNAGRVTITEILIWADGGPIDVREASTSAELTNVAFDGHPVALIPGVKSYLVVAAQAVTEAFGEPNVAVTVLPEVDGVIRIVTMAEDGSSETYRFSTQKATLMLLR